MSENGEVTPQFALLVGKMMLNQWTYIGLFWAPPYFMKRVQAVGSPSGAVAAWVLGHLAEKETH